MGTNFFENPCHMTKIAAILTYDLIQNPLLKIQQTDDLGLWHLTHLANEFK